MQLEKVKIPNFEIIELENKDYMLQLGDKELSKCINNKKLCKRLSRYEKARTLKYLVEFGTKPVYLLS